MACSKQAQAVFNLPHMYFSGSHKTFLEATSTQNVCLEASCPFCSIRRRLVNQPLPERHTGRVASGFGHSKCGHGSAAHIGFHKGVGKCLACFGVTTRVHLGTHWQISSVLLSYRPINLLSGRVERRSGLECHLLVQVLSTATWHPQASRGTHLHTLSHEPSPRWIK